MDLIGLSLNLLAQTRLPGAQEVAGQIPSVWDFVVQGGLRIVPLFVCSLVALAVTIERLVSLRRRRVIPPEFVSGLKALWPTGQGDPARALDYCRASDTPVANIFAAAIRHWHAPLDRLEKYVEEAGQREVARLRRNLRALGVISSVAVLFGLLGTVFGMITAFQTVARSAEALGKTELLAKGVYEALIATAAGLLVAIPALILYHYFTSRVEKLVAEIDGLVSEFIEQKVCAPAAPQAAVPALTSMDPAVTVRPAANTPLPTGVAVAAS
jgi:biopolymer transport protein ExbB